MGKKDSENVDEMEIQHAILELMTDGKIWSNGDLKNRLGKLLNLSPDDMSRARRRENEAKWENRVNNALSLSRSNSLSAVGHVRKVGHGLYEITDSGRKFLANDLSDFLEDLG